MKRRDQILALFLVLQIVLIAVVFWPQSTASGGEAAPLLGDLTSADVVALIIQDADGNRLELAQSTGKWVLPEAGDFPVQGDKVTGLLDKLIKVNTGRLVTRTDASHQRLQVAIDEYNRRIELKTADGPSSILYLGSSPSYGAVHVRLQGQNETYLTSELSAWEANATPNSWIDTSYLSVDQAQVTSITLQNAQGELALVKDEQGNWSLVGGVAEGQELNTSAVNTLVNRATTVTLLRPLGTEEKELYGLSQPKALVTVQTADKTVTWRVGNKYTEDNSYVVKSSESPYYVRVNEYGVKDLVEKRRQDLGQVPPTPTPAVCPCRTCSHSRY